MVKSSTHASYTQWIGKGDGTNICITKIRYILFHVGYDSTSNICYAEADYYQAMILLTPRVATRILLTHTANWTQSKLLKPLF